MMGGWWQFQGRFAGAWLISIALPWLPATIMCTLPWLVMHGA